MIRISNKKICIVSYIHKSGLYYLAKHFFDDLILNNEVIWIPKVRYKMVSGKYKRIIEKSDDLDLPNEVRILDPQEYVQFFKSNNFDLILSFETNMRERWVVENLPKISDIPMIEWVDPNFINCYKYLKEIICLNDYTFKKMSKYGKCSLLNFLLPEKKISKKEELYYHQASLNIEYSSKNTTDVIKAFRDTKKELIITGILNFDQLALLSNNIKFLGVVKKDVVDGIFSKAKYFVAPSSKEGLGLQIYEAKSYGCSIICSNFPTIKHLGDYIIDLNDNITKQIQNIVLKNETIF